MSSLNTPAVPSAVDRLAPIRAAKASLAAGNDAESPVNKESEIRTVPNPGASTSETSFYPPQNLASPRSAVSQTAELLPQQAQPPLSQHLLVNPGQGRPIPARVEEVLRNLRSQFPQLSHPAQSPSNGTINSTTFGHNAQAGGSASHPMIPPSTPGLANTGSVNNSGPLFQRDGVGAPHSGNITHPQANPNQPPGPYALPLRSSTNPGLSGNMATQRQRPSGFSAPNLAGSHTLPQRPVALPTAPRNSLRAEPLGPRSVSSESTNPDGRRGSYNPYNKDYRPRDDRRPANKHDRSKRSWPRSRS